MRHHFVGDVMLGRLVNGRLRRESPAFPWGDTLSLVSQADVRICNLECVLSDRGTPWTATPQAFHFRSDAKIVAVLQAVHLDAVSLLNVPIGDVTDPRVRWLLDPVRQTKDVVGFLLVLAHRGPIWGGAPLPQYVSLGRALIEAGADVVFGHSAHIVQGIELYRRQPILYSTGNYINDYATDLGARNDESCIFVLETQRRRQCRRQRLRHIELYPSVIEDRQARRAWGVRAERIAARVRRLSANLGTSMSWRALAGSLDVTAPMP